MNKSHLLYFLFLGWLVSSCSNTRFLPEGELLYTGSKVTVEGKEASKKEEIPTEKLFARIGQLTLENDFLKKKLL